MPQTSPAPTSSTTPTIHITPVTAAVPVGGGTLDLIVRVQAPDQPADHSAQHRPSPTTALFAGHSRHAWISVTRMPRAPMS
jgi:hypothetical protein